MRSIAHLEPIGRRNLAVKIGMGERILRTEVDKLKDIGMLKVENAGMSLTDDGIEFLKHSENYIKRTFGSYSYRK